MKNYTPRLFEVYKNDIQPLLMKKLNINNVMQLPELKKIVINMGLGDAKDNKNTLSQAVEEISIISGQKPVITKAKNAISNFKIRIGDAVGVKVTLRGTKMYEFLDRFISVSSPRIRDFRGFSSKGFDGSGNYNFGITEQIVFPEIDYDKINSIRGMNITFVTNSINDKHAYELLLSFGFPIKELKDKKVSKVNEKKPLKEVLAEETPADGAPAEETPVEETQREDAPTEEIPAEETPVEETQREDAPTEEIPAEETPVEDTQVEDSPVEETPTEEMDK